MAIGKTSVFRWDAADITKFVMSIMILVLHTRMFGGATNCVFPLLRMAVPLFFMVSAYLFFRKLEGGGVPSAQFPEARRGLGRFVGRSARLYFFWFVILIAPTAVLRGWLVIPWWEVVLTVPFRVVFGSTFVASWYLSASVVALAIIVALRYGLGACCRHIIAVGVLGYALALAFQPYAWIFGTGFTDAVESMARLWAPYNSFPVALFWMSLGFIAAAKRDIVTELNTRLLVVMALVGITLVYAERAAVCMVDADLVTADVFATLPIACTPCLILLLRCQVQIDQAHAIRFRRASTIIYCFHGTLAVFVRFVLERFAPSLPVGPITGIVTLALSLAAVLLIFELVKKPHFGWLRYSW